MPTTSDDIRFNNKDNAQSVSATPNVGKFYFQARAGRDAITVAGGVVGGGTLRIGGGDTHHTFTSYNQFKNQNASKYNSGLSNSSVNIQLGMAISKALKPIHRVKI